MATPGNPPVPDDQKIQLARDFVFANHLISIEQASQARLLDTPSLLGKWPCSPAAEGSVTRLSPQNQVDSQVATQSSSLNEGKDSQQGADKVKFTDKTPELLDLYIDAKDTLNNWCVAKITEHSIPNQRIQISYDGWSSKYDDTVRIGSSRIAHFRTHTQGYTGMKKFAMRDFNINYAYQVTLVSKIRQIRESNFQCFGSATECTQFVRGELYFYFDSLSTLMHDASESDLQKSCEFAAEVFKLVIKWIELFPNFRETYNLTLQHPNLFTVDLNAAIASCGYELLDMLQKWFGGCDRTRRNLVQHKCTFVREEQVLGDKKALEKNGFMLSVASQFVELGGTEKLVKMLKVNGIDSEFKCPISLVFYSTRIFAYLREINVKKEVYVDLVKQLATCIEERLTPDNLTDLEIKDVQLLDLKMLVVILGRFKDMILDRQASEIDEYFEFEIARRFLMSPYFEKRINGMKEFKMIAEKIIGRMQRLQQEGSRQPVNLGQDHLLDLNSFSEQLHKHKVVEFIFRDNVHQELIKRSACILATLSMTQDSEGFPESVVQMIWACCSTDKHEDVVRATFELITDQAATLPKKVVLQFKALIQSISLSQIDDKTILFFKDFSIQSLRNTQKFERLEAKRETARPVSNAQAKKRATVVEQSESPDQEGLVKDQENYFDFSMLWRVIQDSNEHSGFKTKELAMTSLIQILKAGAKIKASLREPFISMALDNINKGCTVYFSIVFLQNLLATYPQDDHRMMSSQSRSKYGRQAQASSDPTIESVIQDILKKVDLYKIVITQAKTYMKQVLASVLKNSPEEQKESEAKSDSDFGSVAFVGGITHQDFVRTIISFVEFIVVNSRSITLVFDHVQELFKIFVTEAATQVETRELFNFLTKQNPRAKTRDRLYLLDEALRTQVFTKIMGDEQSMNCLNLNLQAYECFRSLFMGVNAQEGHIKLDREGTIVSVNSISQLQGLNSLWKIGIYCQNEEVKEQCRATLCDLYLHSKNNKSPASFQKVHESFIKVCKGYLQGLLNQKFVSENIPLIVNCVKLFKTYCDRYDKEHIARSLEDQNIRLAATGEGQVKRVVVKIDPGLEAEVDVNMNLTFWELMRQAAASFKLKMSDFYVLTKQGRLGEEVYSNQMKDYELKEVQLKRKLREDVERENPSYLLGYSKECVALLLDALKLHEDVVTRNTISLLDTLQTNPGNKKAISEKITSIKVAKIPKSDPLAEILSTKSSPEEQKLFNYKDWAQVLLWEGPGSDLSQTMYLLTCLKEVLSGASLTSTSNTLSPQQQQAQDRQARLELQKSFCQKGGLHFLISMLSQIEKKANYLTDILKSKTLQLLIGLLLVLHNQKLQHRSAVTESSEHVGQQVESCLEVVSSFLETVNEEVAKEEARIQSEHKECPLTSDQVVNRVQTLEFDLSILTVSLNFISRLLSNRPNSFKFLTSKPQFQKLLSLGLLQISHQRIQETLLTFCQNLFQKVEPILVDHYNSQRQANLKVYKECPSFVIMELFLKEFLRVALRELSNIKMKTLFKLVNAIVRESQVLELVEEIQMPAKLVEDLVGIIYGRDIRETSSSDQDSVLIGLFTLVKLLLTKFPDVRQSLPDKKNLVNFLTHQGLFKKEKRLAQPDAQQSTPPPLCKSAPSRTACLQLLRVVCLDSLSLKLSLADYVKRNICGDTYWRTPRRIDWAVQVNQQERAASGFVGLKNLGCICYMNSILQQLYLIPTFRKAILEVEDRHVDEQALSENVLHQLKCIFGGLMEVEKQYFNPKNFCKAFKDIDGSAIDPYVQKDVDEFFNMLMDKVETLVKGTREEKVIGNLFQGVLANECICIDCPHYSENEEPFLAVSLQVKNKASVEDSLKFYVEGDLLEGDNAYYCEKCEKKVNTLKRCCIKRMPNTLFLVLKRFEFDFDTMQKVKVNDYCEFPTELDMSPFSQQELARQDLKKKMEKENLSIDDLNEDQLHTLNRKIPDSYYRYKLKGIVVHYGTADQGHYYSFIQDRESKNEGWFEFNDTLVKDFDPKDIPEEAFGGDDTNYSDNLLDLQAQNSGKVDPAMVQAMRQFKTKIKNAYVLIYDRVEMFDMAKVNEVIDDTKTSSLSEKEVQKLFQSCKQDSAQDLARMPQIPHNVHDLILAKNKKFWLSKTIFSQSFIQEMLNIFRDTVVTENQDYKKYTDPSLDLQTCEDDSELETLRFMVTFFLTVAVRSSEKPILPEFVVAIKDALTKNIALSLWLLELFSSHDLQREFFIDCPIHDMSRVVCGLLKTAMTQVYAHEQSSINLYLKSATPKESWANVVRQSSKDLIDEDSIVDGKFLSQDSEQSVMSGCQETQLIKLKAVPRELPRLILFINSLIHLSVSPYCLKYIRLTGIFWAQFSNFASLGDIARLYLLKTKSLGRLIDILLNHPPDTYFQKQQVIQFQTLFRDESLRFEVPLYALSKELYVKNDPERSQYLWSMSEKKQVYAQAVSHQTFLLTAISILIRSCCFTQVLNPSQKLAYSLDCLNFVPGEEEIELVMTVTNVKWWNQYASKLARNQVALMFAHLCCDNKQNSDQIISSLTSQFLQRETSVLRQLERPFLRIMQIQDKHTTERARRLLTKLYDLAKISTNFFVSMEAIFELLLKLAQRCPIICHGLVSNSFKDFTTFLERFARERTTLPVSHTKDRIFKEGPMNWNEIKTSTLNQSKLDWITNYTKKRSGLLFKTLKRKQDELTLLSTISNSYDIFLVRQEGVIALPPAETKQDQSSTLYGPRNITPDSQQAQQLLLRQQQEDMVDADDDLYLRNLQRGDQVDVQVNGWWQPGRVEQTIGEMVQVQQLGDNNKFSVWIEVESDRLAPLKSKSSSEREQLHNFLTELSTFVIKQQYR